MRMVLHAVVSMTLLGLCSGAYAADPPEYNGIFKERDPKTGDYTDLERATPALHTRMRGLGFGGAKVTEDFAGTASPVRFKAGAPLEFVVRNAQDGSDPNATIQFIALTSKSGGRYVETYSAGGFSGMKNTAGKSSISFTVQKFQGTYFKLSPTQPLAPGEYALTMAAAPAVMMSGNAPPAFCFGVDP